MPSRVVSAKTKKQASVSESLTLATLVGKFGFSRDAVLLRVKQGDTDLYLWPAQASQGERIQNTLGISGRLPIYAPPAFKLRGDNIGSWLLKLGRHTITAFPHPTLLAQMEKEKLIDTSIKDIPGEFRFTRSGSRWLGRVGEGGRGPLVVPIKGWEPGFDPQDKERSMPCTGLKMRAALTACVYIAGPAELIDKATLAQLAIFDEEMAKFDGPLYAYANEFYILGGQYTAFELFGDPIGPNMDMIVGVERKGSQYRGMVVDIEKFKANVREMRKIGDKWLKRTLIALLHSDLQGTSFEPIINRLFDAADIDETTRQTAIKEVASHTTFEEVQEVFEESMREAKMALDWFDKWAAWAEEELITRQEKGLKLLIPLPYNRPARSGQPLVQFDSAAVAQELLDWIYRQAKRRIANQPAFSAVKPAPVAKPIDNLELIRQLRENSKPATARSSGRQVPPAPSKEERQQELANRRVRRPKVATVVETPTISASSGPEVNPTLGDLLSPAIKAKMENVANGNGKHSSVDKPKRQRRAKATTN